MENALPTSIVIPCLNEAETLASCIGKAQEALNELGGGEIVIADNGSTDGSQQIARDLGCRVVDVAVRGYGAALIHGIRAARYSYVVMADADDSYDFREAPKLVRKLAEGYELCLGTRLGGTIVPGAMPWKNRYVGTPALTMMVNKVYGASFSDVNSGMRAFTKVAFDRMQLESTGMQFASEMLVKAAVLRLKVTEVPITLHKDGRSRPPHLRPWRDGWRHLKLILLFAPSVIYWIPASIMLVAAVCLAVALNSAPSGQAVHVFGIPLNDHWMIVDALVWLVGYQVAAFGLMLEIYSITHRLHRESKFVDAIVRHLTLEKILLFALVCLIGGTAFEASVVDAWVAGSFGNLNQIRPAVTGMALILMAIDTVFIGFFYAVLVEQYAGMRGR